MPDFANVPAAGPEAPELARVDIGANGLVAADDARAAIGAGLEGANEARAAMGAFGRGAANDARAAIGADGRGAVAVRPASGKGPDCLGNTQTAGDCKAGNPAGCPEALAITASAACREANAVAII